MNILAWAVLGLIAGAIAKMAYPGKQSGGIFATIGLGVIGALAGGYLGTALFGVGAGFSVGGILVAVLGAMLVLFLYYSLVANRL